MLASNFTRQFTLSSVVEIFSTLDCMQTILNNCSSDIHPDYLNDAKIWADWISCIETGGKHWLIFTNTDWFNNNNDTEQVYLICTRLTSSVHSMSPEIKQMTYDFGWLWSASKMYKSVWLTIFTIGHNHPNGRSPPSASPPRARCSQLLHILVPLGPLRLLALLLGGLPLPHHPED